RRAPHEFGATVERSVTETRARPQVCEGQVVGQNIEVERPIRTDPAGTVDRGAADLAAEVVEIHGPAGVVPEDRVHAVEGHAPDGTGSQRDIPHALHTRPAAHAHNVPGHPAPNRLDPAAPGR